MAKDSSGDSRPAEKHLAETELGLRSQSRRRLLKAGATAGVVAAPMMITIRSASAQVTGITEANWHGHHHGGGGGGGNDTPPDGLYGSIACIQHIKFPQDCDKAADDVCRIHTDCKKPGHKSGGQWSSYSPDGNDEGRVYLANQSSSWSQPRDKPDYDDLCDYFGIEFYPSCKFNPTNRVHCTYVEMCLSSQALTSIKQATGSHYAGCDSWDKSHNKFEYSGGKDPWDYGGRRT